MSTPRSTRSPRPVVRGFIIAVVALAAGCSSTATGTGPNGTNGQGTDAPFDGVYRVSTGSQSFDVNVESNKATVVRFGPGFEIGSPEVINGGDLYLKGLTRVDSKTFRAQVASITWGDSTTFPKKWPTSMSYVETTLQWDEATSKWTVSSPKIELSKQSQAFGGKYAPAGACEKKFVNNQSATLYTCEYPQDEDGCSSSGERAFWPSTDCKRLGYAYYAEKPFGQWQHSSTSNVTPGAQGKWGDGTGGGKIVNGAGGDGGGGGGGGGTAIASCSDTWVCSEILTGDAAAFQAQCTKGGDIPSASGCPSSYKGGPACLKANFTSVGKPVTGHFFWKPTFCANNPNIDTKGTCDGMNGTATGTHCAPR